jgi:hypothetical protein
MRFQRSICLLLGRKEARRHGARCHGVARRLLVWSLSAARALVGAEAGGWSTTAVGDASLGGGMQCRRAVRTRARRCGASGGDVTEGRVRPGTEARSALSEQAMRTGRRGQGTNAAQSERTTYMGSVRTDGLPVSNITDSFLCCVRCS